MLLALGCHHFGCHSIVPDPITEACGEQLGQRARVSTEGLWREEFAVLVCMRPLCVARDVFSFSPGFYCVRFESGTGNISGEHKRTRMKKCCKCLVSFSFFFFTPLSYCCSLQMCAEYSQNFFPHSPRVLTSQRCDIPVIMCFFMPTLVFLCAHFVCVCVCVFSAYHTDESVPKAAVNKHCALLMCIVYSFLVVCMRLHLGLLQLLTDVAELKRT